MELYEEILLRRLRQEGALPAVTVDVNRLAEQICYQALRKIKAILEDDALDDPACFARIEEIVCVLEELGSDGGVRHDFG